MYNLIVIDPTGDPVYTPFSADQVDDALLAFHDACKLDTDVALMWDGDEPHRVAGWDAFTGDTNMLADEHFRLAHLLRERVKRAQAARHDLAR